jgi:hypothetical protein
MSGIDPLLLHRFAKFFQPTFLGWLVDNKHIYDGFEARAMEMIAAGRTHYSARAIVESLVHHSRLQANNDPYKTGNHYAPDLARVFAIRHPEHAMLWEYRKGSRRGSWQEFLQALGCVPPSPQADLFGAPA